MEKTPRAKKLNVEVRQLKKKSVIVSCSVSHVGCFFVKIGAKSSNMWKEVNWNDKCKVDAK